MASTRRARTPNIGRTVASAIVLARLALWAATTVAVAGGRFAVPVDVCVVEVERTVDMDEVLLAGSSASVLRVAVHVSILCTEDAMQLTR